MNKVLAVVMTNRPLQIFLIAVAVLGLVYWYGRRSISDTLKYDHPLPNSGSGIPTNWSATAVKFADDLHGIIDGLFTLSGAKDRVCSQVLALTDDQITAIYNAYNRKYCTDSSATLTRDLDGEFWRPVSGKLGDLVSKLKSLNLR
ncbi:MAG: hypothetical protein ACRYFZ_00985 [Janthinobacterium lividum]